MAETSASCLSLHILGAFLSKGDKINNLKLQKLLYYCQAWYLANYDKPLFGDPIQAWVHGPVVPIVFQAYKFSGWSPIHLEYPACMGGSHLPGHVKAHLDNVLSAYGGFSGWDLERLTHREDPWRIARAGLPPDASSASVISHESMKSYYRRNG
jgi:uncharacterized phage-associated protein